MDLRQVRYFVAIVEAGSIFGAAKRLNVAQPALSRRIKDLESALGVTLLARHSRGVQMTEDGARFLPHAHDMLSALTRAEAAFPTRRGSPVAAARLSFGVTPTPASVLMPQILGACNALDPPLSLSVRQGSTPELQDLIARRAVDGIMTFARPGDDSIDVHPLHCDDLVLVGRATVIGHSAEIPLVDAADIPLILDPRTHVTRHLIDRAAAQAGIYLDLSAEIEPIAIKRQMLATQDIATISIFSAFAADVASGHLVARRIVAPCLTLTLNLVLQRTVAPTLRQALTAVVSTAVTEVIEDGRYGWRPPL